MNEEKLKELLNLYVLGETNDEESQIVENHLLESDEYLKEYEELKKIHDVLTGSKPVLNDESMLLNARRSVMEEIKKVKSREPFYIRMIDSINSFLMGGYRPALSAAFTLFIGLLIGYFIFTPSNNEITPFDRTGEIDLDNLESDGINISNIRFMDPFGGDGEIEINFDAVRPVSFKGSLNDPVIRKLLTTALTKSENPGVRIRSVNTLASKTSDAFLHDPKIEAALINALKSDGNDGVRREALNALMKFPYSDRLRDALLFVLTNDSNPGLKVGAINALAEMKLQGRSIDNELKTVIDNELNSEQDDFIKLKAASLIREVN